MRVSSHYRAGLFWCLLLAVLTLSIPVGVTEAAQSATSGTALVDAARRGDETTVRSLLSQGTDPNSSGADGTSALHWAARIDDVGIAELLIDAGADASQANFFGATPLSLASVNGSVPMLERLLDAGADPNAAMAEGETPLMTVARVGSVEAVMALLARGADPNALHESGQTALMWAAAENHPAAMRALLEGGADVDVRTPVPEGRRSMFSRSTKGFTAFLFAVRAGHLEAVDVLLDAGADVNDTLPDGSGVVVLAATNAHWELGVHLVDRGADPNGAENGWTALHAMTWVRRPNYGFNPPRAVRTGNIDSITFARELVARGADINARMTAEPRNGYRNALNRIGATPLLMAARLADEPLMRAFVELGADPTLTNEDGTTLLMVASGVGIHSPGEDPGTEEEAHACVEYALELNAGGVNDVDANGDTPLHGAAYRGSNLIVNSLVEHGANTFNLENEAGWTPVVVAKGVFRTGTYKEAPATAALLEELMSARAQRQQ